MESSQEQLMLAAAVSMVLTSGKVKMAVAQEKWVCDYTKSNIIDSCPYLYECQNIAYLSIQCKIVSIYC